MTGDPVVIEAAINGVTNKRRNPNVPLAPDEIAIDALACIDAGAGIVHNHVDRVAVSGPDAAERYLEGWRPVIAARPDALLYPTTNAGPTVVESYSHVAPLAEAGVLRMGLCDPGSVNFGALGPDGLPGDPSFVYTNSFTDVRHQLGLCRDHRLGPSLSIFEPGFLRCALAVWRAGAMPPGAMVKLYFGGDAGYLASARGGVAFGLPPTPTALEAYLELLEGCDLPWSVAVLGGDVLASPVAELAVVLGGHLRVGLEDYAGPHQPTNVQLVRDAVELCERVGRPVATPAQAAERLELPAQPPVRGG
ncbi:MAG: 3-keto-5-aminohexanoate cleavage protein [Acidimicrobiia bacterium]